MSIFLAQALPTLPPETPWFVVVTVVILFICAPFVNRYIDKKLEIQQQAHNERIEQIKAEAAENASTSKTIDTLVSTLERFTSAMNARDAREFDERALFREAIGKNTQGLSGVDLALRAMGATLLGLKENIDRWPLDFRQIIAEVIEEDRKKRKLLTTEIKAPTSTPPESPTSVDQSPP